MDFYQINNKRKNMKVKKFVSINQNKNSYQEK